MDFADSVIAFFVDLRGKGASVSAIDQQQLLDWEREGVPLHLVLEGIEDAFARKSEPPKSVRECKRWVTKRWKAWKGGAPLDPIAPAPALLASPLAEEAPVPGPRPFEERLDRRLRELASSNDHRLRNAADALAAELKELRKTSPALPTTLVPLLDVAFAMHLVMSLDEDERASIRAAASAAALSAREHGRSEQGAQQAKQRETERLARAAVDWGRLAEA